ncbi:MAG: T9SS type A sorting domain-containing protein [Prevotella sp.]|jgi:hypothetical protein|nr:T9SS type A sorting domain-containing protein [Prevotella sp.]
MKQAIAWILLLWTFSSSIMSANSKSIRLRNDGKMNVAAVGQGTNLSVWGSIMAASSSAIGLSGRIDLTGDFINNISSGHVFDSGRRGYVHFRGKTVQYIKGQAGKSRYIDFPNICVENKTAVVSEQTDTAAVIVCPNTAINADTIRLKAGRLILESDTLDATSGRVAHLLANHVVIDRSKAGKHEKGLVQVNLAAGNHYRQGKLLGFTPPFKTIYADYFFYNFLSRPTDRGLFGDSYSLITNPKTPITGGLGYIVGLGVIPENDPYYQNEWDPQWNGTNIADRFTQKLSFAREFAPAGFTVFVNNDPAIADKFTGESLNTSDVPVTIEQGWNYLGNPFTVPLDMSSFLNGATSKDDWGVTRGDRPTDEVQTKYYVLSQGQGKYHPNHAFGRFEFSVTYLVAQKTGGTTTIEPGLSALVAPMQLFVIKKNTSGTAVMNIPAGQRKHENVKYLREAPQAENELLLETKDDADGGYDRLCVVFRQDAQGTATDKYDALKIFNNSGGVNQIYTLSEDNKRLTTNVAPLTLQSLKMNLKPASVEQNITLRAYRQESLTDVKTVILEDTHTGVKTNLMLNPEYRFTTKPEDTCDRFILYFSTNANDIENTEANGAKVYYNNNTLNIKNIERWDIQTAAVLDIQGRLLFSGKTGTETDASFPLYLGGGAYLVKLTGKGQTITRKLIVQ